MAPLSVGSPGEDQTSTNLLVGSAGSNEVKPEDMETDTVLVIMRETLWSKVRAHRNPTATAAEAAVAASAAATATPAAQ